MESRINETDDLVPLDKEKENPINALNALKESLSLCIDYYIDRCTSGKACYSFFEGNKFNPHYSYGYEGKIRAENYKDKINKADDFNDLISMVLCDLNDVIDEHKKPVSRRIFEYVKKNLPKNKVNSYEETTSEAKLGNSTELAGAIAKNICVFLKLESYNKNFHEELIRNLDEKAGSEYLANELIRYKVAIENWKEQQENFKSFSLRYI